MHDNRAPATADCSAAAASAHHRANLRAAGLTAAAVAVFAVSDAVVKLLTAAYPPGQILFCRGAFACLFLAALARARAPGPVRLPLADRAAWLRAFWDLAVSWCYFHALAALPLAEATAVLFVFPLLLTAMAALVLKERVGLVRGGAVALGLAGVLLILRPGTAAFDPAAFWALAAALGIALRDLTTRFVHPDSGSEGVALLATAVATLAGLATAPFGWAAPDAPGMLGFAASGALVSTAFVLLVAGTRAGDVSFAAAFRYVTVPLSFALGYAVWGQVPDAWVLAGTAVVVLAGLLVLRHGSRGAGR